MKNPSSEAARRIFYASFCTTYHGKELGGVSSEKNHHVVFLLFMFAAQSGRGDVMGI